MIWINVGRHIRCQLSTIANVMPSAMSRFDSINGVTTRAASCRSWSRRWLTWLVVSLLLIAPVHTIFGSTPDAPTTVAGAASVLSADGCNDAIHHDCVSDHCMTGCGNAAVHPIAQAVAAPERHGGFAAWVASEPNCCAIPPIFPPPRSFSRS